MKKISILLISVFFFLTTLLAQQKETPLSTYILLKNANIIDCIGEQAQKGDLLIKDQQIENVAYQKTIVPPKGAGSRYGIGEIWGTYS